MKKVSKSSRPKPTPRKPRPEVSKTIWDAQEPRLQARIAKYQGQVFGAMEELSKMEATATRVRLYRAMLERNDDEKQRQLDILKTHLIDENHFAKMKDQATQTYNRMMTEYHFKLDTLSPMELYNPADLSQFQRMYGDNLSRAEILHRDVVGLDLEIRCAIGGEGKALDDATTELESLKTRLMSMHTDNVKGHQHEKK